MTALSSSIKENIELFKAKFHNNSDISFREFTLKNGQSAALVFLQGVCDSVAQREIFRALLECQADKNENILDYFIESIVPGFGCVKSSNADEIANYILSGETIILVDGNKDALMTATAMWQFRSISEPPVSTIVSGPREGFTEDLKINITQIRRRLMTPSLVIERLKVGRYSNTDVAVIYLDGIADKKIINKIRERINKIDIDAVLDINYIQQFLEEKNGSIFRQASTVEKPDIVCGKILEGRVAIMINGSPIAITIPYLFLEDFQQSEDYYTRPSKALFLRALRVIAVLVGIILPGFYVSVQVYHYNIIPLEYLITLMNAVQGLPMKPMLEILVVILLFEIIHEASFRMPKYVGMAMSIVGALVLGDTAVKAGLISTPAIMFVALSSIALYTVPDSASSFRLLRIVFTFLAGLSGIFGIVMGGIFLSVYISRLDTYGTPYLAPFAPLVRNDLKDSLLLRPMDQNETRPKSFPNENETRMKNEESI